MASRLKGVKHLAGRVVTQFEVFSVDLMKTHQVQWAAQFAAGAELVRRGYSAAFFLGNEPSHDLVCKGTKDFRVQVKGFSWDKPKSATAKGGYLPISDLYKGDQSDLIVIVYVPKPPNPFEYFIATRGNLQDAEGPRKDWQSMISPRTGKPYKPFPDCVRYCNFKDFKDRWELLPDPIPETTGQGAMALISN
jgi:hypothetical protein